jgi:hypothetical protein
MSKEEVIRLFSLTNGVHILSPKAETKEESQKSFKKDSWGDMF